MGGGSYSKQRAVNRSRAHNYADKSADQIFQKKSMDNAMNPKGIKVRESRDSDEHPESVSIIMGLDVTGSMGHIPKHLITQGLTKTMSTIIERGVEHPQILFLGVGDHISDQAPLQVAQFESSDPLLDKWLKDVYLEGNGGGNGGESYMLAWYFAAYHTSIDCLEKRNQKGILFTIGDEPLHESIPRSAIQAIMGDTAVIEGDQLSSTELLKEASEKYHVRHLHLTETPNGGRPEVQRGWKELMGDNAVMVDHHENIPDVMARITLELTAQNSTVVETVTEQSQQSNQNKDEVVL